MKTETKAFIYAVIAILSWSTVASAFKIALKFYSNITMLLVASLTAVAILSLVVSIQKKWSVIGSINRKGWIRYGIIGLLNPLMYYLILFKSYNLLPAQLAQPINYTWPIFLTIILAIRTRKAVSTIKYFGMLISLAGVVTISLGSSHVMGSSLLFEGMTLALLSAVIWALFWCINNANKNTDHTVSLLLSFFFGTLYLIILSSFMGVKPDSLQGTLASMYIGIFEMAIPFVFFGLALKTTGNPVFINQLSYFSPFISLFIIHFVLKETIYVTTYIGLSLIVSGILFNEFLAKYILSGKFKQRSRIMFTFLK